MARERAVGVERCLPPRSTLPSVLATFAFRADTEPMAISADPILVSLAAKITEAINTCLQRGMKLPFVVAMVGSSGSVFCLRYDKNETGDGLEATPLAEHGDPGDFASPINMMVFDKTGQAARVTITDVGLTYH